jgi:hypothetical protein
LWFSNCQLSPVFTPSLTVMYEMKEEEESMLCKIIARGQPMRSGAGLEWAADYRIRYRLK